MKQKNVKYTHAMKQKNIKYTHAMKQICTFALEY